MDIFRISFYDQFKCLAGDCPETCCKGFSIPVEEKTYEKLRAQQGLAGVKARLCITGAQGDRLLNRSRRKCPYLKKDGLCALQVLGFGVEPKPGNRTSGFGVLQPHACKIYPRRRQNLGLLAEETLDLSCPETARLFLKADFPLTQRHLKGEVPYGRSGNNDDEAFLKRLLSSREELIWFLCAPTGGEKRAVDGGDSEVVLEIPASGGDTTEAGFDHETAETGRAHELTMQELSRRFAVMLEASEQIQERCTHGEAEIFAGVSKLLAGDSSSDVDATASDAEYLKGQNTNTSAVSKEKKAMFPLGISIMNEWLNGDIYNDDLLFRMPLLYEVCKLYFKRFDKLNDVTGQIRLDELYDNYFKKIGRDVSLYVKYAAYYLYRFYTDTYEDYSFIRRIRDMVMHTNLLLLLNALYVDEYGKLPDHIETRLLASYEKRAFHSFGLRKSMYKKWAAYEGTTKESIDSIL